MDFFNKISFFKELQTTLYYIIQYAHVSRRVQRSLDLFNQLIATIRPVSIFYQSSQGYQCNN